MNYNLPTKSLPKQITAKGESFRLSLNGIDFAFEKKMYAKMITLCKRITKEHPILDAFLVNSGYEGDGKTNTSLVEAIIAKDLIKNTSIHLFFKTSSCIEFAKKNERKIIILDEPSFESLSTDSGSNLNKDLLRLTSTMRKKRHFFIMNFAKFWKFPEFLVIDRALGMVHMDSKQGKDPGKFMYIRKKNMEKLWNGKKKNNKLLYSKTRSFGGRMPYLKEEIFEIYNIQVESVLNASDDDYEEEKDKAIESIGSEKKTKTDANNERKLKELRNKVSMLWKKLGVKQQDFAKHIGIPTNRLREWAQLEI